MCCTIEHQELHSFDVLLACGCGDDIAEPPPGYKAIALSTITLEDKHARFVPTYLLQVFRENVPQPSMNLGRGVRLDW